MAGNDVVIASGADAGSSVCLSESSQTLAAAIFPPIGPISTKWSVQVMFGCLMQLCRLVPACCPWCFSTLMTKFPDLSTLCENQSFSMASLYDKPLLLKGFVSKVAQI